MKIHIWLLWPSIGDPNGVSIGNVWIPFKKSFFGGSIAATRPKRPENNVETFRKHPGVVGTRPGAPIMEISASQVLRFGGSANNLVQYCSGYGLGPWCRYAGGLLDLSSRAFGAS